MNPLKRVCVYALLPYKLSFTSCRYIFMLISCVWIHVQHQHQRRVAYAYKLSQHYWANRNCHLNLSRVQSEYEGNE